MRTLALILLALPVLAPVPAQAQQPLSDEELRFIARDVRPIFFGGLKTSGAPDFSTTNDYVIVEQLLLAKVGDREKYDFCDSEGFDSNFKVIDTATFIRTRMGNMMVTLTPKEGDPSRAVGQFTITDVIRRQPDGAWKIIYENVNIWQYKGHAQPFCNIIHPPQ